MTDDDYELAPGHQWKASPEEEAALFERLGEETVSHLEAVRERARRVLASRQSGSTKLDQLIALAEDFTGTIAHVTACQGKGCSHCCKMAVNITEREAMRIARATGRKMVMVPPEHDPQVIMDRLEADVERYSAVPCPFLVDDACSIYAVRPLACRLQHSLEPTPDPCDLTKGRNAIRRLNTNGISMVLAVMDLERPVADIRAYFP